jgi:hypothetical protein
MRVCVVLAFTLLLTAACSSSSSTSTTSPTPTLIAGDWVGTVSSPSIGTLAFRMTLLQTGSNVTGTWLTTSVTGGTAAAGALTGSENGNTFTGSVTITGCANTVGAVSGAITGNSMTWTGSQGFAGGPATCTDSRPFTISVQRQ